MLFVGVAPRKHAGEGSDVRSEKNLHRIPMSLVATRHLKKYISRHFHFVVPLLAGTMDLKKIEILELFKIELNSETPRNKTWNLFNILVLELIFGTVPSGKCHDRPQPNYLPTKNIESRSLPMRPMPPLSRRLRTR